MDRAMLAVAVALAAAGLVVILTQSPASRLSSDFTINYSAGVLVRQGDLAAPYDQAKLGAIMRGVAPDGAIDPRLPFSLPLAAALPYAVLSLLPFEVAFRLCQLLSAALMLIALLLLQRGAPTLPSPNVSNARMALKRRSRGPTGPASGGAKYISLAVLGVLAAVPTWGAFTEGQPTAWLLLGATIIVLSPLAGGAGGVSAMVHNALSANQAVAIRLNESWIGVIGAALPPRLATLVAIALYLAVLMALCWLAWRHPPSVIGFAALAGALAVLASPHALPHDLLILVVPAWLAIVLYRQGALPNPLPALLAIDLAVLIDLRGIDIPLGPIVMTAVVAWYGWQFRQRAAQQRRPPIGRAA